MEEQRMRRLAALYARGRVACRRRDAVAVRAVVRELTGAVAFDCEAAARELCLVYDLALRAAARGRFDISARIFGRLGAALDPAPGMDRR